MKTITVMLIALVFALSACDEGNDCSMLKADHEAAVKHTAYVRAHAPGPGQDSKTYADYGILLRAAVTRENDAAKLYRECMSR